MSCTLGSLLAELRRARGLTVAAVIERLGVARSTAYHWEGPSSRPSPEELGRLLDLYEASDKDRLRAWSLRASPLPPRAAGASDGVA